MHAKSQAQQKLMGAALAAKKGSEPISPKVAELSKSMSRDKLKKYAGTKHKGLPKTVKKENTDGCVTEMYAIKNPYSGCQSQELVVPFDPIHGVPQDQVSPDAIHGIYHDRSMADAIAEQLYEDHVKYEGMIEEKKGTVVDKIKSSIDKLEKSRKHYMEMTKSDPKSASTHREKIASITSKIDELVSKMEMVEKSKKQKKEEELP
jgi:hypothetical protein